MLCGLERPVPEGMRADQGVCVSTNIRLHGCVRPCGLHRHTHTRISQGVHLCTLLTTWMSHHLLRLSHAFLFARALRTDERSNIPRVDATDRGGGPRRRLGLRAARDRIPSACARANGPVPDGPDPCLLFPSTGSPVPVGLLVPVRRAGSLQLSRVAFRSIGLNLPCCVDNRFYLIYTE